MNLINDNFDTKIISSKQIENFFADKKQLALDLVEKAFISWEEGKIVSPAKISQVFDDKTLSRINCMSATLLEEQVCGMKWVSIFPENYKKELLNITALIILSTLETGYPIAVMDGSYITALRTAALGSVAVKYLAKEKSDTIGFIGSGLQAKNHFRLISLVRALKKCYVASRRSSSEQSFIDELQSEYPKVEFIACNSDYKKASENADIIITATSGQQPLLKAEYVKEGSTYIHVGLYEDEYKVVRKADKIICDSWEAIKHSQQTISRMYHENLLSDDDIYADFGQIVTKEKSGRDNDKQIIYFATIGLAFLDVVFANAFVKNL